MDNKPLRVMVCPFCASQDFNESEEVEIRGLNEDGRGVPAKTLVCANPNCSSKTFTGHSILIMLVPNVSL